MNLLFFRDWLPRSAVAFFGQVGLHFICLWLNNLSFFRQVSGRLYGVSVWDLKTDARTKQENLVITPAGKESIRVDKIKVAQLVYLLVDNKEIGIFLTRSRRRLC